KLLNYLTETGRLDEADISELHTHESLSPGNKTIPSNPAERHLQTNKMAEAYRDRMTTLAEQEKLINSVRETSRKPLPADWYDIHSKLINGNYDAPDDSLLNESLTAWDNFTKTNVAFDPEQRTTAENIRENKTKVENDLNTIREEIKEIENEDWSESKINRKKQRQLKKLQSSDTELHQLSFEEERLYYEAQSDKSPAADNKAQTIATNLADSLHSLAMDIRIKTANNQKLTDSQRMQKLEYATGLLQEANNILHLSADADETAEIPMKLRKLINYYHPEAGPDSDMLASNEGSTETTEDKKRQNNEQTDAQKPDEQERSPDTQTSPDKSQETSETSTEQNQNGQASGQNTETESEETENTSETQQDDTEQFAETSDVDDTEEEQALNNSEDNTENLQPAETNRNFFYRIQVVALREPLQGNTFRNMRPVVDEQVGNRNLYRYMAGKFYNRNSWQEALPDVKQLGFDDAFPVAYLDGRRLSLVQARPYLNYERNLPPEFSILEEQMLAENREANQNNDGITPTDDQVMAEALNQTDGGFYAIQIGVFSKPLNQNTIGDISTDLYNRTNQGYYRYFHGQFNSRAAARVRLAQVRREIRDAFITYLGRENEQADNRADGQVIAPPVAGVQEIRPNPDADTAGIRPEFRIQIGAFETQPDATVIRQLVGDFAPYEMIRYRQGNLYYYQITGFENYPQARQFLRRQVLQEVPDAFMLAYRNNVKITVRDALLILKNY
ncbi:MAG TPA: hypothetical protein VJ946_00520, partial [Bacteroidales bacterium]|nr:hypothetical protein [Bacteroidales bacterium]